MRNRGHGDAGDGNEERTIADSWINVSEYRLYIQHRRTVANQVEDRHTVVHSAANVVHVPRQRICLLYARIPTVNLACIRLTLSQSLSYSSMVAGKRVADVVTIQRFRLPGPRVGLPCPCTMDTQSKWSRLARKTPE